MSCNLLQVEKVRGDFPFLNKKRGSGSYPIYLDSAATTQKPRKVIDLLSKFYLEECGTVHRAVYQLAAHATERYERIREEIAHFIGANLSEEIVFTSGTTASINLVALAFGALLQPGDEVIVSEMEHHSNLVPWHLLAKRQGVILKVVPVNDAAELDLVAYNRLLSNRTKLVSIAHVANATGTINPVGEIVRQAHLFGAKVMIDGAQSIAHLPIDVKELDVDFFAFSSHKAFGPTGLGVLYGKKELLEQMPPVQGGGDMIEQVTLAGSTFQPPPFRFEAGTPPIGSVMGFGAALSYIQELGLEAIHHWEQILLAYATDALSQVPGLEIIGKAKEKSGIISFVIDRVHHLDLGTLLDLEGISIRTGHHCAQPLMQRFGLTGTCRISFAPFNTLEEIDRLVKELFRASSALR